MAKKGKGIDLTAGVLADVARESARRTTEVDTPTSQSKVNPIEKDSPKNENIVGRTVSLRIDQLWLLRQYEFRSNKAYQTSAVIRAALDEYFVAHAEDMGIADLIADDGTIMRPADGRNVI